MSTNLDFGGYNPWDNPAYGGGWDYSGNSASAPKGTVAPAPTQTRAKQTAYANSGAWANSLTGKQRDAAASLINLFRGFGLESLARDILDGVRAGQTADTIYLQLQQTDAWKRRFAGNEARSKAGLPVLSPAEYLSVESSYRQTLQRFGFPKGFYDQPSDFAGFIGNDLSAAELQDRAQLYYDVAQNSDPALKAGLAQLGIGVSGLAAHLLDPGRAAPLLQKEVNTIKLARQANRAKLQVGNQTLAGLTEMGVTEEQGQAGFGQIAGFLPQTENLAKIYGQTYGTEEAISEVFSQDAGQARKRRRLASQERANFSGGGRGSLGTSKLDF